jgi:hypothetical protein
MTANPVIEWLDDHFEQAVERHKGDYRYAPGHRKWRGPSHVRPMIELLPVTDAGNWMRVTLGDYDDPGRWWL